MAFGWGDGRTDGPANAMIETPKIKAPSLKRFLQASPVTFGISVPKPKEPET